MRIDKPSIEIIIVNWNGMNFLPACLASIAASPPSCDYEVIVVDNVSSDGSREWLLGSEAKAAFAKGNLRVMLSDTNLGFGRANNLAIEQSSGELVFILNPDTIVKPGAIDRLIEVLTSDDKIGAVSPKLLNADGTLQPSVAQFPPNPVAIVAQALRIPRFLPSRLRKQFYGEFWEHDELRWVPVFWGTAILARREMIDRVGAFDPEFFMYGEDVEWCVRINRSGWKTVFVPDAEIIHLGGKSSEQAWRAGETTLRKDSAEILAEKKSLSRTVVAANSLTRAGIYSLAYLRRILIRQERDFLKSHIKLHLDTVKELLLPSRHKSEINQNR